MPAPVRIVVLYDAGLFLDNLGPRARASHGRAQEYVDDEHEEEEDPQGDGQPQQPRGVHSSDVVAKFLGSGRLTRIQHEDARGGHEDAVVGVEGSGVPRARGGGAAAFAQAYVALE